MFSIRNLGCNPQTCFFQIDSVLAYFVDNFYNRWRETSNCKNDQQDLQIWNTNEIVFPIPFDIWINYIMHSFVFQFWVSFFCFQSCYFRLIVWFYLFISVHTLFFYMFYISLSYEFRTFCFPILITCNDMLLHIQEFKVLLSFWCTWYQWWYKWLQDRMYQHYRHSLWFRSVSSSVFFCWRYRYFVSRIHSAI